MLEQTPPDLPLPKDSPVRILVQTMTHLVPRDQGMDNNIWGDKVTSMLHRISRYHWRVPYWPFDNRFYSYGDEFGYSHRLCFFLVDHGTTENDDEVPILCYEWTGEDFKFTPELLASKEVQDKLKEYPFTPATHEPDTYEPFSRLSVSNPVGLCSRLSHFLFSSENSYIYLYTAAAASTNRVIQLQR
ncbi:hypothetical protein P170DRAFT_64866 [Aspergillus steynii IBT 23096]|uniref:Uncharacterized protein n=1 Tax=Aspergillus steynii IBT 23096 TaxID=1392250 RepID=A0A2I2FTE7_9EURO|nr:uncharacterized protein P170DRAFT_64866 [Aspergillus steynii IBT 23096]PLB43915.1 hypothetical protein P170DRAFT_64866 [Aspergillus steynii IBT 23096]